MININKIIDYYIFVILKFIDISKNNIFVKGIICDQKLYLVLYKLIILFFKIKKIIIEI